MSTTRTLTFRLPDAQVAALETVARFDGVALAEELREGVELLLAARRDDPEFRKRVHESIEQARSILAEVDGGDAILDALTPRVDVETSSTGAAQPAYAAQAREAAQASAGSALGA